MTEAAEILSVVVERDVPHPPEKVWRAMTQQHLIAEWLLPNDFEPVIGHKFKLRWEAPGGMSGVIDGQVRIIEPERTLAYSWDSMGVDTVVTLTLTPTSGGTHVRMEQVGFRPDQQQNLQGAKYGWTGFLAKLDDVAGKG